MRNAIFALMFVSIFCGCNNEKGEEQKVNTAVKGSDFEVTFLFEHDGVKVYRFYDGGYYRYYVDARGSALNLENHGKAGMKFNEIQTVK